MAKNPNDDDIARQRGLTPGQVRALRLTRGLGQRALERLPENALRRAVRRLDFPDFPRAREAFRRLLQNDEDGSIPVHAVATALDQLDSTRTRSLRRQRVAGLPTGDRVLPRKLIAKERLGGLEPRSEGWVSLGPGNVGGRTRALVIHPAQPQRLWAGSSGGGVWRSNDGGTSWEPVDDFMANLAIPCLAMDPTDPRVIYAGTGEGFTTRHALYGEGIFRTTDGVYWQRLPATTGADFRWINRLALSADGAVLLVATPDGILRSSDPERLSFESVLEAGIGDVVCHPEDPSRAIAGSLRRGEVFTTGDGGRSWRRARHDEPWSGRVELTYAAADPGIVYASVDLGQGQIWRSTDGGRSFERRPTLTHDGSPTHYLGDQGWYGNTIWAGDPSDGDFVIVGGIDLWRSRDGGATLEDISTWWEPASAHADHHTIVAHPHYDGETCRAVYFGNDGGIYFTEDAGAVGSDPEPPRKSGWHKLVNNYGVTQFYGAAGNPETGVILAGAQDNGTVRFTPEGGAQSWTTVLGGDGGHCAADPSDADVFYGEYIFLNIHRSTDGGETAEFISGQHWDGKQWAWKPIPYRISDAMNNQALFIAPFVLDPNRPETLLAGGVSLWRTDDAKAPNTDETGPSWQAIKSGTGAPISAIAVARGDSDLIWVAHTNGRVYKTASGTTDEPIWQRIDHRGRRALRGCRYATRVVIDPREHDVVYVTYGGYARGNIWKTKDGGESWRNLGWALPAAPAHSLEIHPRRPNYLYAGTEVGLFASEDGGISWSATNEGPTNCSVDHLFWMGEVLHCATHGRGMFCIDLSRV